MLQTSLNKISSRKDFATQIVGKLLEAGHSTLVLSGERGVGKTALIDLIVEGINKASTPENKIILMVNAEYACSALQFVEIISRLLETYKKPVSLSSKIKAFVGRIRGGVNEQSSQHALTLASAGLFALIDSTAGGTVLLGTAVTDIIKNAESASISSPSRKTNDIDNDFDMHFSKIANLNAELRNFRFYLVLNKAENFDVKAFDSAIRFVDRGFNNINMLFVCAENRSWLKDNEGYKRLLERLEPDNTFRLESLTPEELREWKLLESGQAVAFDICEDAVWKTGGLPSSLSPWVASGSTERMAGFDMEKDKKDRFSKLSESLSSNEFEILQYLASVDMIHGLDSETLSTVIDQDRTRVMALLTKLRVEGVLDFGMERYYLKDLGIADCLVESISQDRDHYKNSISKALDYDANNLLSLSDAKLGVVAGVTNPSMGVAGLNMLLVIAGHFIKHGLFLFARDILSKLKLMADSFDSEEPIQREFLLKIDVYNAEILNQSGKYQDSIDILENYRVSNCEDIDFFLTLGESYLRLNKYEKARIIYARAVGLAEKKSLIDEQVRAQLRRVTICIDQEDFKSASKIIATYSDENIGGKISDKTRCQVFRWKARVLVSEGKQESYEQAILAAEFALDIAEKSLNKRQIGNSMFVLGYVYMHRLDYRHAERHLKKSLEIATEIGNKDLEVYDLIVLTLNALYEDDLDSARQWCFELTAALNYKAPLESLYRALLQELINHHDRSCNRERCRELLGEFSELGRSTAANISDLLAGGAQLPTRKLLINDRIYL